MYVFGSRVRGNSRPDSDLDIAIEIVTLPSDMDAHTTWVFEAATWRDSLMGRVSLAIDLESHDASEANPTLNIRRYIANASVVMYPKT